MNDGSNTTVLPNQWTFKKLKYVARLAAGDAITSDEIREAGDYPVFGGNGLRGYADRFNREGDFVLIGRQGALCGNINYASGQFWASEHAIVADVQGNAEVHWLGELLKFMNLNQYSQSAAQAGTSLHHATSYRRRLHPRCPEALHDLR
jgi:type I restriction enzyme, S subunit